MVMAERSCSITGCRNTFENKPVSTRFFRFPRNKNVRKVWIEKCRRPGIWDPELCMVCSDHFTETDYYRDFRMKEESPFRGLRLKGSAVPSLRLYDSESTHVVLGSRAVVARPYFRKILSRDQMIDVAFQPQSDPLALNVDNVRIQQVGDCGYEERKADIRDLIYPRTFAFLSGSDPLDLSDGNLRNLQSTNQGIIRTTVGMTGALKTYSRNKEGARKKFCPSVSLPALPPTDTSDSHSQQDVEVQVIPKSTAPCIICSLIRAMPFNSMSLEEQKEVILAGRPMSDVDSLNQTSRRAAISLLNKNLSLNQLWWITSSDELKKIFCWPCVLFGKGESFWNNVGLSHVLPQEVEKHENSELHVRSFLQYTMFVKDNGISSSVIQTRRPQIYAKDIPSGMNKEIFCRLIDAVCILSKMEMPKYNQDDNIQKVYLDIIDTFSEYDASLKSYLQSANENKLTSETIRNGLTNAVESLLIDSIKQEVESAKCVSIICGEVSDELKSNDETLFTSVVLRFVDGEGIIRERFVGYIKNSSSRHSVKIFFSRISKLIDDFKLEGKLIFFSNDGQHDLLHFVDELSSFSNVVMVYVPSLRKSYTLVLKQLYSRIEECHVFVTILPRITAFFTKTSKQRLELEKFFTAIVPEFYSAALDFELNLERTLFKFLPQFLKFFDNVIENPENWDRETVINALGFKAFLQNFSTIFFLHIFSTLFIRINLIHKIEEFMKFSDYSSCAQRVSEVKFKINIVRSRLNRLWTEALAKQADCDLSFDPDQTKKNSEAFPTYAHLFHEIIRMTEDRITEEFASFEKLKFLDLLNPVHFKSKIPSAENLELLQQTFPNYFDMDKLRSELVLLYGINDLKQKLPDKYIVYLKTLQDAKQLVEIYKLVCLYLTVPCTQASLDPTFSALKRMTNIHENLGHQLSSNLAVLAIESTLLSQLKELQDFYDRVMNEYAKQSGSQLLIDYTTGSTVSNLTASGQSPAL